MADSPIPSRASRYPGWVTVLDAPCPWCALWIGPHEHWVREDGTLGVIVRRLAMERFIERMERDGDGDGAP